MFRILELIGSGIRFQLARVPVRSKATQTRQHVTRLARLSHGHALSLKHAGCCALPWPAFQQHLVQKKTKRPCSEIIRNIKMAATPCASNQSECFRVTSCDRPQALYPALPVRMNTGTGHWEFSSIKQTRTSVRSLKGTGDTPAVFSSIKNMVSCAYFFFT